MDKIKYFLYARKSSESEDRQVQSIDDQIRYLKKLARHQGLKIVGEPITEEKSAKAPYQRPMFAQMIERINKGEANGILCWKLDRLARNAIDAGTIIYSLQQGTIQVITTCEKNFLPAENVVVLNVEFGIADQYVRDLSKNVKRGMHSKYEKGWLPTRPPLGYLNDKAEKKIIVDKERFPIIRKIWDLMLTGCYTPPKILEIINKKYGLKTVEYKKLGGKELSRSGIYKILSNIFYVGILRHDGEEYSGRHERMITSDEFDRVQILLGKKGKPRRTKHDFAFTGGLLVCGECGCFYTAETKTKFLKGEKKNKDYTFYHCTRKRKYYKCSQRKSIRVEELERQIDKELFKITILPEFKKWALQKLNRDNDKEIKERATIYQSYQRQFNETQKQIDSLTQMRYRDLISDEEYLSEKSKLFKKREEFKTMLENTETRADKWLELGEKMYDFAVYAREAFNTGNSQTKREVLACLGKAIKIKDKRLELEFNDWLVPIAKHYKNIEKEYLRLELDKNMSQTRRKHELSLVRSSWFGDRDSNSD